LKALIAGLAGLCWLASIAPGGAQDIAQLELADTAETFRAIRLDGNLVRWQRPSDGAGLEITYRTLTEQEPRAFASAHNCRGMTGLDSLLAASGVARSAFASELAAAFAMWEAAASLTFRAAGPGEPANIVIGAQVDPQGWAFADLIYDAASPQPIKPISQALICLNPARRWKVGFDGNLAAYDLRYTLAHEIGHAIGLDHPDRPGQIMAYRYEERFRELQPGDVLGAVALYGAPLRPGTASVSDLVTAGRQTQR
jgi:hypothetical protein